MAVTCLYTWEVVDLVRVKWASKCWISHSVWRCRCCKGWTKEKPFKHTYGLGRMHILRRIYLYVFNSEHWRPVLNARQHLMHMHELRILNRQVLIRYAPTIESRIENKLDFEQHFLNNFLCLKAYRQPNVHWDQWPYFAPLCIRLQFQWCCVLLYLSGGALLLEKWMLRPFTGWCTPHGWMSGSGKTPPKTQRNYKQTRIKLKTDKSFRDENVCVDIRLVSCFRYGLRV